MTVAAKSSLVRSSLIVMAGYLAGKLVALIREPLIARAFGTGGQLDAYYAAFKIPDLLFTLIAGGALVTAFIPLFAETLTKEGEATAWRMASSVINLVMLATLTFSALAWFAAPELVGGFVAPGFAAEQQALTVDLMRLIFLSTFLFGLAGVLMGVLNARQHFLTPAFAPVLYNLGIVGGALFLAPRFGIYGLAYGVIIGAVMYLAIHIPPMLRIGFRYEPVLMLRAPVTRELLGLMGPRILALGVVQLNSVVSVNLASRLETGSVSALNLAYQLMQVPETVIATAIATAVFPTLSQQAASGNRDGLRSTMSNALRAILLLSIPAVVGLLLLGRPLVQALYQGGRFNVDSTSAVVWALNFYALGLIGQSFLEIGARVFYAQKDTLTPLLVAVAAMALNALLAMTLMTPLGHGGIALANTLAVSCEVSILLVIANRRLGGFHAGVIGGIALRALVGAAAMAALIWAADLVIDSPFVLLGVGALGSGLYLAVIWFAGVPEARSVLVSALDAPRRFLRPASVVAPVTEPGE